MGSHGVHERLNSIVATSNNSKGLVKGCCGSLVESHRGSMAVVA